LPDPEGGLIKIHSEVGSGMVKAVEAMASHRPYRPALGNDKVLEEIARNQGSLYDAGRDLQMQFAGAVGLRKNRLFCPKALPILLIGGTFDPARSYEPACRSKSQKSPASDGKAKAAGSRPVN
jgi:hypothetical protein